MKKKLPVILFLCALIWLALWYARRPVAGYLTPERLEENLATGGRLVLVGDTCYELEDQRDLGGFCDFSHWYDGNGSDAGERILTVHLGDEYEIAFYENDWVKAYDGYASWKTRGTVWYKVTEQNTQAMIEYIRANGVIKKPHLGPESWFVLHD